MSRRKVLEIQWDDGSEESFDLPKGELPQVAIALQEYDWLCFYTTDNVKHYINSNRVRSLREVESK